MNSAALLQQIKEVTSEEKYCPKCKEILFIACFGKDKSQKDGLNRVCYTCINKQSRELKAVPKNKEKNKKRLHKFLAIPENKEKIYKQNRKWRKQNRSKCNTYNEKYKSQKVCATPFWATSCIEVDRITLLYELAQELTKVTGKLHHVDHIIPLQGQNPRDGGPPVSGLHCVDNLRVVLANKNISKQNFTKHCNDEPVAPNPFYYEYCGE